MPTKPNREDRIGFRGREGKKFELTGGSLCLDFANTVDNRPTNEPKELLGTYADLVAWSLQASIVRSKDAERLWRYAKRNSSPLDARHLPSCIASKLDISP